MAAGFVVDALVGHSLRDGVEELVADLRSSYFGAAQGALVAALRDIQRKYNAWRSHEGGRPRGRRGGAASDAG